jgi:hypothetical protein
MWLATQHGFYSIVKKAEDVYFVRGRVRRDLDNLVDLLELDAEVLEWDQADYRYRIIVNLETFREIMVRFATNTDYPNFKARICQSDEQSHKLGAYHRIWEMMADIQFIEARKNR